MTSFEITNYRRVCAAFVGLTLLKVVVFATLVNAGRAAPFIGDNATDHFIPAAHRIVAEGRFNGVDSRGDSKVAPGYSVVLSLVMRVAPENYPIVTVCLQMVGDLVTALILFWLGVSFVTPLAGAASGAVWLLYPPEIALTTYITAEPIFTTVMMAGIALLIWSLARDRIVLALGGGALLGLATLFRGTTLFLPGALIAIAFVCLADKRRAVVQWGLACALAFVVVVVPWTIRNIVVLQDPIPVAVGFGGAFMQGADEGAFTLPTKRQTQGRMMADATRAGIVKPDTDHESAIDNWMLRAGLYRHQRRLADEPLSFVPFLARKAAFLWFLTESGAFRAQVVLALCSLPLVLPALLQLWRWNPRRSPFAAVCLAATAYFILLHFVTGPLNRYMLPIYPVLCLAACDWWAGLVRVGSAVRSNVARRVPMTAAS